MKGITMQSDWFLVARELAASKQAHFVYSLALARLVWTVFEKVDSTLSEIKRLEIAVWLLDVNANARWRRVIAHYVLLVGGPIGTVGRLLSVSLSTGIIPVIAIAGDFSEWVNSLSPNPERITDWDWRWAYGSLYLLFTLLSMLAIVCSVDNRWQDPKEGMGKRFINVLTLPGVFFFLLLLITVTEIVSPNGLDPYSLVQAAKTFPVLAFTIGFLLSTAWLWLYGIAAIVLRLTLRVDHFMRCFTHTFDIEKKPLQAIGLVASILTPCLYWIGVLAVS